MPRLRAGTAPNGSSLANVTRTSPGSREFIAPARGTSVAIATPVRTRSQVRGLLVLAFALWASACEPQPRNGPLKEPPPAPTNEDTIHVGPLSGKLDGKPFTAKSARYFRDTRTGFEKLDIKIYSSGSPTPCGDLDEPKSPSVWLRRWGADKLSAEEKANVTVAGGGKWEVHYQYNEDGFWFGAGDANALIVTEAVRADMQLPGVVSACFKDTTGSCVAGEFLAAYCRVGFDEPVRGTEAMERPKPGLLKPATPPSAAPAPSGSVPLPAPSASAKPPERRP